MPVEPKHSSLNDAQLKLLRERMEKTESSRDGKCRRKDAKVAFHRNDIVLKVGKPGTQAIEMIVAAQDLSPGGICLLHSRFVHVGTACRLTLKRRDGGEDTHGGTVVWCRLVAGTGHAIGVKFASPVAVDQYVGPAAPKAVKAAAAPAAPPQLKGRVLLIDPSESDRLLFAFHLGTTAIETTVATTAAEAFSLVATAPPDVVMCELNLPDERGETLIAKLRSSGFVGYIAALTAESDPARLAAVRAAGANAMIVKPYDGKALVHGLTIALRAASRQPIHSAILHKTGAAPLVAQYVDHVRKVAAALRDAVAADDLKIVRDLCVNLKGTGAGYGFTALSDVAQAAAARLDASQSIMRASPELALLQSVCHRLSAEKAA